MDLLALAVDVDPVLAEVRRRGPGELEGVDRLQARLVAPALDARRRAELVEELGELARRGVDHLHVALLRLAEVAHADQRLREAVDRRERGAQIVRGERDEAGETGIGGSHGAA